VLVIQSPIPHSNISLSSSHDGTLKYSPHLKTAQTPIQWVPGTLSLG
jgi:hypothetical protein